MLNSSKRKLALIAILAVVGGAVVISIFTTRTKTTEAGELRSIFLPGGYRIELVVTGLTCPTAITWDTERDMYLTLLGDPYGGAGGVKGKIARISPGKAEIIADGLNPPVTSAKFIGKDLYVSHKGTLSVFRDGNRTDLITGLPWGDYSTCDIAFKDGWIYVGNGTCTNSGVVGEDNFNVGWAKEHPDAKDVPPKPVVLAGENYPSPDFRLTPPQGNVSTGAFVSFGNPTAAGQAIPGNVLSSGVILRVRPDGTDLQVYAWGLRNPFGMGFDAHGRLLAIDQGFDDRGSRPVGSAPDAVYAIEQDKWYGWPDYSAGIPVTDPRFRSATKASPINFVLSNHPPAEKPIATLQSDMGSMKFDFAKKGFDKKERMFVAAFGPLDILPGPSSANSSASGLLAGLMGQVLGQKTQPTGQILAVDLATGGVESFAYTRPDRKTRPNEPRLNHPIDVKFGPDGYLYVVDFGEIGSAPNQGSTSVSQAGGIPQKAVPGTGAIWRISKQRSEYTQFVSETLRGLDAARERPWKPDYAPLKAKLQAFLSGQPEEWGLYFKDLVSGDTFGINENVQIPAASTVKVAVVLYASELVNQGKLSWNEQMVYSAERDWRSGAGTLQFTAKDGDLLSIRELAEKAIRDSDNVAWKMLERRLGRQNIINFMWQMGGTNVYPGGQNISTPKDNATYMEAALNFARESQEGQKLIFDLAHTVWNTGLNRYIDEVPVAHKEGDVTGVADDVGIVFADFPYILSIMSQGHEDVEDGFEKIGEISKMVFDYHKSLPRP